MIELAGCYRWSCHTLVLFHLEVKPPSGGVGIILILLDMKEPENWWGAFEGKDLR